MDSPDEIEKIKAQTESELDALQKEYDEQMAEAERLIASAEAVR